MRKAAIALLLCGWTAVISGATFEARSKHHALAIEVQSLPSGEVAYDITVTDRDSNEVLLNEHPHALPGAPLSVSSDVRDLHITVHVSPKPAVLMSLLEVEQGDMLIDSISSDWGLAPRRAHLHAPGAVRVGGDVKAPRVLTRVNPHYPEGARRNHTSGVVILEVLIDKSGIVRDTLVVRGQPDGLSEAAADAVKQWTFEPATRNGEPVDVIFNLTVNFKLDAPAVPQPTP